MRFARHTLLCVAGFAAIIAVNVMFWYFLPDEGSLFLSVSMLVVYLITHSIFIVYFYVSPRKYSLFALPLSLVIVSFCLIILGSFDSGGWAIILAIVLAVVCYLPLALLTSIISSARKRKESRDA
jgi:hypothetical protein